MTLPITAAVASIVIGLLSALIALTWRSATLATRLLTAVERGEERTKKIESRLDEVPTLRRDVDFVMKNHSIIPQLSSRLTALEEAAKFSKEWRRDILRRSRPDNDED